MSKLFDTLEQIRRHETFRFRRRSFPLPGPSSKGQAGRKQALAALLVAAVALAAGSWLLRDFRLPRLPHLPIAALIRSTSGLSRPLTAERPRVAAQGLPLPPRFRPPLAGPATSLAEQQFLTLNNKGVEAAHQGDSWRAVYFFTKASGLQPGRPEPFINLGVVLLKLDLPDAARRAFEQAYAAAPNDPRLRENLELLAEAGLLEGKLAEAVAHPSPGKGG
ncbi:MAG: hypothetical protein M0017_06645 [Desulfobacteraceae bacterium]|nr:hypothetical protein [Desulfobacteraceae bacterium]